MVSQKSKNFLISALVGTVIGAAVTLLFTPISGLKLRKKVLNGFNQLNGTKRPKSKHLHRPSTVTHRAKALHARAKRN